MSGLKAMDSIRCLVLYNLQTPVLSTTTQKMKLLSKYITEKQRRITDQFLHTISKGDGLYERKQFSAVCQSYENIKQTKQREIYREKKKKPWFFFFTVTSSAAAQDTDIGPYMQLPSRETIFM